MKLALTDDYHVEDDGSDACLVHTETEATLCQFWKTGSQAGHFDVYHGLLDREDAKWLWMFIKTCLEENT